MTDKIFAMGVINITPNSFSDGGKFKNLNDFVKSFQDMLTWVDVIDIGAESTAPFNDPIDAIEELNRFEKYLFPLLAKLSDPKTTISIDTYRPEVFYEVYLVIKHFWPKTKLIFNDVSGKIDDDLVELLGMNELDFDYVYSHNLCPSRDLTSAHMDYCSNEESIEFLRLVVQYFRNGLEILKPLNRRLWVDPCFGFSKTRAQNHILLKNFKTFLLQLPWEVPIVYGVSRKSFLRVPAQMNAKDPKNQVLLDQMQSILIYDLLKDEMPKEFMFRLHEESSLKSSLNLMKILAQ